MFNSDEQHECLLPESNMNWKVEEEENLSVHWNLPDWAGALWSLTFAW